MAADRTSAPRSATIEAGDEVYDHRAGCWTRVTSASGEWRRVSPSSLEMRHLVCLELDARPPLQVRGESRLVRRDNHLK